MSLQIPPCPACDAIEVHDEVFHENGCPILIQRMKAVGCPLPRKPRRIRLTFFCDFHVLKKLWLYGEVY